MFAEEIETIKRLCRYLMEDPGLMFKVAELILSFIAYSKTLNHYAFGYWEIFVSQTIVLGTFTVVQCLSIMRFLRAPPRPFERIIVLVYGVLNIASSLMLAYKIHTEKQQEDLEAAYAHLTCIEPDFTDQLYLDFLFLFICNMLLGIIMVFDGLSI